MAARQFPPGLLPGVVQSCPTVARLWPMTERRAPLHRPLDGRRLEELALAYAARFATTRGKLTTYLHRKLRERGWAGEGEADVAGIVARFAEAGYVDDAAFARARTGGLLRRGYGARRI